MSTRHILRQMWCVQCLVTSRQTTYGGTLVSLVMSTNHYRRTLQDTLTVIQHAKLEDCELKPLTQVLCFKDQHVGEHDYKFIELDASLLNKLQEGQSLTFRGENEEMAVICTEDTTFDVKEAETSNSMLLLSDLKLSKEIDDDHADRVLEERQVLGVYCKYFELRVCKPRLRKLLHILKQSEYRGKEFEEEILGTKDIKLYTFDKLLEIIQASETELLNALQEFLVCKIGDYWRLLEHDYQFQVVSLILKVVEENSWPYDGLVKTETLQALADLVNVAILDQVFNWFAESTGKTNERGHRLYRLDEKKVCRFLGEILLRQVGKFNLQDFLLTWEQSVPEGMKTDLKLLEGLALYDTTSTPQVIWLYPEMNLPEDVTERFQRLFETRAKWTLDEIRPYVQRLGSDTMNVNALLTKYARASTVGGVKYYSAKHGK